MVYYIITSNFVYNSKWLQQKTKNKNKRKNNTKTRNTKFFLSQVLDQCLQDVPHLSGKASISSNPNIRHTYLRESSINMIIPDNKISLLLRLEGNTNMYGFQFSFWPPYYITSRRAH